MSNIANEQSEI